MTAPPLATAGAASPPTTTGAPTASPAIGADAFALLADPLRLRLVELLADGPRCTCHLVEATGAKQTTVSHHLRALREAGAVTAEQQGRFTWYRMAEPFLRTLGRRLDALADLAADERAERPACP